MRRLKKKMIEERGYDEEGNNAMIPVLPTKFYWTPMLAWWKRKESAEASAG